jgi:hypothetical protein
MEPRNSENNDSILVLSLNGSSKCGRCCVNQNEIDTARMKELRIIKKGLELTKVKILAISKIRTICAMNNK